MTQPAYPAARIVSARLAEIFEEHRQALAPTATAPLASIPPPRIIESMVDTAFWTSLRREEQHSPQIALAYVSPEHASPALEFEHPLNLHPTSLTKIAPGMERPGIYLGVRGSQDQLVVWGATRTIPTLCFVVEALAPGLIVIKYRQNDEGAKFVNVAVLEGDQIKILDRNFSKITSCPSVVGSLLGLESFTTRSSDASNILIRLAISMRAHGRGGSLLVVPRASDSWRSSIAHPITYALSPAHTVLSTLIREGAGDRGQRKWNDAVNRVIDWVAGMTAVDGATIITEDGDVLAFGAKIIRKPQSVVCERVSISEPVEGSESMTVHPTQLGGTRHLSAAQFAHDQRDAIALVASQDGPFTVFAWSACDSLVEGFRVEALLL
ncbi:MAG: hypothetical protein IT290_07770 [Deltaproteobacteria bacterium]|nr:hypothetical protein [Deltaproteobacteria bacterium]